MQGYLEIECIKVRIHQLVFEPLPQHVTHKAFHFADVFQHVLHGLANLALHAEVREDALALVPDADPGVVDLP